LSIINLSLSDINSHRTKQTKKATKKNNLRVNTYYILPLKFIIIPLSKVLLPPTERRIKPRCCVDEVGRINKFCIRLSAENDPESERDEETLMN